jgi:glycosyltransferase involved in cell wall biosynthesis
MNKNKTLIITYYWPPAGGPGVQRWLKFVKYLPENAVTPIVYIPDNPNYPIIDESLSKEVSASLEIIKIPISEPYKWATLLSGKKTKTISSGIIAEASKQSFIEQILLFIRGNFFIPDARKNWVKPSVKFLREYITTNNIETVITTGPPHSLHLIGLELKKTLDVNWLADFRDPWTTIGYHDKLKLTNRSKKRHKELEKEVLNTADQLIVTSLTTKNQFEQLTEKPIAVITNGYDTETSDNNLSLDAKFTMSHIGSLLSKRNPEVLWQVLRELLTEVPEFSKDFQLNLIGTVSKDVIATLDSYKLSDYVNVVGYVSHRDAITFQKKSQILLLVEIDSEATACIIPGKLFEYMASKRPIVAVGPKNSDVETLIDKTQTGNYYKYHEHTALKNVILKHYKAYKNGILAVDSIGVEDYSRASLTKVLADLIKKNN